jgi:hypothetical protein
LVLEAGRALAGWFGAAGAVVLSGVILFGFAVTGLLAGAFTLYALVLTPQTSTNRTIGSQHGFQRVR